MSGNDKNKEKEFISESEFKEGFGKRMEFHGFQATVYFLRTDTGMRDDISAVAMYCAMDCAKRYIAETEGEIESTEDGFDEVKRFRERIKSEGERFRADPAPYRASAKLFIEFSKIVCADLFRNEFE